MRTPSLAGAEVVCLSNKRLILGQEREEKVDGNAMLVFVEKYQLVN